MPVYPNGLRSRPIVTDGFGMRTHPVTGVPSTFHYGVDSHSHPRGFNYACRGGQVIYAGYYGTGGLTVMIRDADGHVWEYMHHAPNSLLVSVGDWIPEGAPTGATGTTGASTGIHCHCGLRAQGKTYVDPYAWISKNLTSAAGSDAQPFSTPKDNELMPHLWKYTSARPERFIIIDHLNMTYRIIAPGSLEEGSIKNDIEAGVARFDLIADPQWGELFGNGQFRQITKPDAIGGSSAPGSGASEAEVKEIVKASELRVIAKIPTKLTGSLS